MVGQATHDYGHSAGSGLSALNVEGLLSEMPVMRASDLAHADPGGIAAPRELAGLLPAGMPAEGLVLVTGNEGCGLASLCYRILSAGTAAGEYAALLDPAGRAMPLAVLEAGVDPGRFLLVRANEREHLPAALGAMLDGFSVVGVLDPQLVGMGIWSRVGARARERHVLAVAAGRIGAPGSVALRIELADPCWESTPGGLLARRTVRARVIGDGPPREERISLSSAAESPSPFREQSVEGTFAPGCEVLEAAG